jgi:hypothetical protein
MKRFVCVAAVLAAGACASSRAVPAPPPPATTELTIEVFEAGLAGHGEWHPSARHGRVWRPLHVPADWQPYLHGEWVWTGDGWFWLTDEPWGWATYHYGRWAYDPVLGWIWVPGFVWAPAWVAWRVGDGFVGWAPLYPGYVAWWIDAYPIVAAHWIFVPTHVFVGVRVETVAVSRARVAPLIRVARPAPPPDVRRRSDAPALGGPPRRHVEKHVGHPVRPTRIVAAPTPSDARRRTEGGAIPVYRPAPTRTSTAVPTRPAPAPAPAPTPAPAPSARRETPERAPAAAPEPAARPAPRASKPEDDGTTRTAPAPRR